MSLSSSLNAGVMGLNVNSAKLATISNNVANSSTPGYKRVEATFSSLVLQQRRNAYAAGGVRVDTTKLVNERGSLVTTGSSTDISIGGQGMLPVTDTAGVNQPAGSRSLFFTPTGDFAVDQNGLLVSSTGLHLMGWPADANGDVGGVSRRSGANLEPVNVNLSLFSAQPTTEIELGVNVPAVDTQNDGSGDSYQLPIEYFDNLGKIQTLNATFTPVVADPGDPPTNQWQVAFEDQGAVPAAAVGSLTVTFNDTPTAGGSINTVAASGGASYSTATGKVTLTLASGPVDIDIGEPGNLSGLTQLSTDFSPGTINKNGSPLGEFSSIEIDSLGSLEAVYDTGFRRVLYQIPVAMVPNLNGLTPVGGQSYTVSQESGDFFLWDAGDGPTGNTVGFSQMESTADIGTEMTELIKTQRAYASNAKLIQVIDEVLQETTNIIR